MYAVNEMIWPKSRSAHAVLAFVGATLLTISSFRPIFDMRMNQYVVEYPHDGQDSLGAFLDACVAGFLIEIVACVLLFKLQRRLSSHPMRQTR
jgi:hypothetical protein